MLNDSFGRTHSYLRIAVADRCNLRCRYCMPETGVDFKSHNGILTFEEIHRLVSIFATLGIRKIRLTGGEPTVRKHLPRLVSMISALPGIEEVTMTSNGILLADILADLHHAGLNRINISLDSLRPERFRAITQRDGLTNVLHAIDRALSLDMRPVKLNVVVMRGVNDDELLDFVDFAIKKGVTVRFIEFMPFAGNRWQSGYFIPSDEIRRRLSRAHVLRPLNEEAFSSAREWEITGTGARIGFISPLSNHFCGSCNRLRLTVDGTLHTCLFSGAENSLRDFLRRGDTDEELIRSIRASLNAKQPTHPGIQGLLEQENKTMIAIGG